MEGNGTDYGNLIQVARNDPRARAKRPSVKLETTFSQTRLNLRKLTTEGLVLNPEYTSCTNLRCSFYRQRMLSLIKIRLLFICQIFRNKVRSPSLIESSSIIEWTTCWRYAGAAAAVQLHLRARCTCTSAAMVLFPQGRKSRDSSRSAMPTIRKFDTSACILRLPNNFRLVLSRVDAATGNYFINQNQRFKIKSLTIFFKNTLL